MGNKCNWCPLEAQYSYGWRDKNGIETRNYACGPHRQAAFYRQRNALQLDKTLQGIGSFIATFDAKDWIGVVGSRGDGGSNGCWEVGGAGGAGDKGHKIIRV